MVLNKLWGIVKAGFLQAQIKASEHFRRPMIT